MKRRDFIKYGSASLSLPFWLQNCQPATKDIPITVHSDHKSGHLIMESLNWPVKKGGAIGVAIVGGGIAGITAAYQLRDRNIQLFELSDRMGGTSGAASHHGIRFSQGAHYDLSYPEGYGEETLSLLEELTIIQYESWKKQWTFVDRQHIIPPYRKQQCYDKGARRKDVIPEGILKDQFVELINSYSGKTPLPTRLINGATRELNQLSFTSFIEQHLPMNEQLKRQLDYHMYDDYGGNADIVSALAGVLYFACRPYYTKSIDLFSPPNGNHYFASKMLNAIDPQKVKTGFLVRSIEKNSSSYQVQVIDIQNKEVLEIATDQVIYAGQKHALKYIFPEQASLFKNDYAPWMTVNLITKQQPKEYGFWQNEYIGENPQFLGFIDSSVQDSSILNGHRVFTGYYCLSPSDREYLTTIEDAKNNIVDETHGYVEQMLNEKINIEAAYINVMGHAMPIPKPGYLFNDANAKEEAKMRYAGVDNGRLPLLFEALDSGIEAAKMG